MSTKSTRTLLLGLFVTAGRPLTARQVIALAAPLGISATNAKSHLTRMVAAGALQRSGPIRRARYRPSAGQARIVAGIDRRLNDAADEAWDGTWLMLTLAVPAVRRERGRLQAALWFDGFRPFGGWTFVRPAWPRAWALARAREYLARFPGRCVHGELVGSLNAEARQAMYALDRLDRDARRLAAELRGRRIAYDSPRAAFAAGMRVGGRVARLVGHDPRLPAELWGGRTGLRDLVRAFRRFEARVAPAAAHFLSQVLQPPRPRKRR